MSSSSVKQSKAWKKYQDTKKLLKSKPELSWLGDKTGMEFDQKIRFLSALLLSYGININLREAMCVRMFQKFVHESNLIDYADQTLDAISKLSVLSPDDLPRKEKEYPKTIKELFTKEEEKESLNETESENHRKGVVE